MRKLFLVSIILFVSLLQFSCKDFWHPEGPSPETLFATITIRVTSYYSISSVTAHNKETNIDYQIYAGEIWNGDNSNNSQREIKVPAGTYTISGYISSFTRVESAQFYIGEKASKLITFYRTGFSDYTGI